MKLELDDIQGLVKRGYSRLPNAEYCLVSIRDGGAARAWISQLAGTVYTADRGNPEEEAVNIAFTHKGLERLGVVEHLAGERRFSIEFEGGMVTEHRSRILGDHGESHPKDWEWGGLGKSTEEDLPVHAVLMLFARDLDRLDTLKDRVRKDFGEALSVVHTIQSEFLRDFKEHFGFRDGIAQPVVAGFGSRIPAGAEAEAERVFEKGGSYGNVLAAGEILLGYPNVYGRLPSTPCVMPTSDVNGHLPNAADSTPRRTRNGGSSQPQPDKDLGRNGSYLVMRQLRQRVHSFWSQVNDLVKARAGCPDPELRDRLAAKMVGRWRDGSPLVLAPNKQNPELATEDAFGYYEHDADGFRCPVGSHIRRANPRDGLEPELRDPTKAAENAMKHRLLRRGRPYGPAIADPIEPEAVLRAGNEADDKERGLVFVALNANIGRQFEFIQHTWLNNPKFGGLYRETDPLFGLTSEQGTALGITGDFTVQRAVRERYDGLPRFIQVVGGAYFFLPGIRALRYIGALPA